MGIKTAVVRHIKSGKTYVFLGIAENKSEGEPGMRAIYTDHEGRLYHRGLLDFDRSFESVE